jgi:hypothetical protein
MSQGGAKSTSFKKGQVYPNQGKRGPNKATVAAREAIARFVDDNAGRMQGWLDKIAEGSVDPLTGEVLIPPNPQKAYELFQTVIEYHVPKLARQEVVGDKDKPITINIVRFDDDKSP